QIQIQTRTPISALCHDCWGLGFNLMFLSALPGAVLAVVTSIPDPAMIGSKKKRASDCLDCCRDCCGDCCVDGCGECCGEGCKCGCGGCCDHCNCCDGGCDGCSCDCH